MFAYTAICAIYDWINYSEWLKKVNILSVIRMNVSGFIFERNQMPMCNSQIIISGYLVVSQICQTSFIKQKIN